MRLEIKEPTTPEEWSASRCQQVAAGAYHGPVRCEDKASYRCDACGKRVCSIHRHVDDWKEGKPDLCLSCWLAGAAERARQQAERFQSEIVSDDSARKPGILERLRRAWVRWRGSR